MMDHCWTCGSTDVQTLVPMAWDATYLYCNACGHQCELQAAFGSQDEPYYEDESHFYFSPFSLWLSQKTAKQRIGKLQEHLRSGHVLEIGPGSGQVLAAAERAGYRVSAVENSQAFVKHLRKSTRARVFDGLFDQIDFQDEKFDGVLSFHVVEHIPKPIDHLRRMHDVTKPGGYLFLATPNSDAWDRRVCKNRWTGYSIGHLNLFSLRSMTACLERAGWEIVRLSTVEFPWQLLWSMKAAIRPRKATDQTAAGSNVKKMPLRLGASIVGVFGTVTKPLRSVQERLAGGNEIFVVARRPPHSAGEGRR
jgi:2-polyprenyl-3-methyl-5-hydroxy-6-metoxy-1,4-benzoquinol methylase